MAAREHRVSRRALLGAAFLPLIPSDVTRSASDATNGGLPVSEECALACEEWIRGVRRFRQAEAVLKAAAHEPDEERYGDLVVAFNRALRKLLRTPAPDLPALALKIDLTIDHEVAELTGGDACLAALRRDARGLCLSARSPPARAVASRRHPSHMAATRSASSQES